MSPTTLSATRSRGASRAPRSTVPSAPTRSRRHAARARGGRGGGEPRRGRPRDRALGSGKGFCGGYDLVEYAEAQAPNHDPSEPWDPVTDWPMMSRNLRGFKSLLHSDKPVACKVHGYCVAGGTDLALCSDLLVIADDARIGYPPARLGRADLGAVGVPRGRPAREAAAVHRRPDRRPDRSRVGSRRGRRLPQSSTSASRSWSSASRSPREPARDDEAAGEPGALRPGPPRHPGAGRVLRRDRPAHTRGLRVPAPRRRVRLQGSGAPARPAVRRGRILGMKSQVAADRLRDLQSVTDAALAYLPLEVMLDELLARVIGILDADTAAILLLDDDETELVARAARDSRRRSSAVCASRSGAASPAGSRRRAAGADREPRGRGHLQPDPAREGPGVHARSAAAGRGGCGRRPARRHAHRAQVRRRRPSSCSSAPGDRAALAISSRPDGARARPADALQRSLMPRLPQLPAWRSPGATCPPRARLGGDWYDAFHFPTGGSGWRSAMSSAAASTPPRSWASCGAGCGPMRSTECAPGEVLESSTGCCASWSRAGPPRSCTWCWTRTQARSWSRAPGTPTPRDPARRRAVVRGAARVGAARRHAPRPTRSSGTSSSRGPPGSLHGRSGGARRESLDAGFERSGGRGGPHRGPGPPREPPGGRAAARGSDHEDAALLVARAAAERLAPHPAARRRWSRSGLRRLLGRWLDEAGATQARGGGPRVAISEACANAIEHAYGPAPGCWR